MNEEVHVESSGRTGRRLGKVVVAMGDLVRHRGLCLENKQRVKSRWEARAGAERPGR